MTPQPIIRNANKADLEAIIALDHIAPSSPARRRFLANALAQGECFVANLGSQTIAYAILNYTFFDNGFIPLLYVADQHRRKGVGLTLLHHAEANCQTPKLFTSTNRSNQPMQNLLTANGYQRSGVIENLDEGDPEMIFFKRIKQSSP
jgi:ribosomal protein S18 acetylase RimI-like enzyme